MVTKKTKGIRSSGNQEGRLYIQSFRGFVEKSSILKILQEYDDFDVANEDDVLEEFLGIPRKTPKSDPEAAANVEGGEAPKTEGQPAENGTTEKT